MGNRYSKIKSPTTTSALFFSSLKNSTHACTNYHPSWVHSLPEPDNLINKVASVCWRKLVLTCLFRMGLIGGLATSTVILLGDRDRVPGWGANGAEGAAWAERGSMAGVLGLNIKFFWGRRLSSSLPFSKPPLRQNRHDMNDLVWLNINMTLCDQNRWWHSWYFTKYWLPICKILMSCPGTQTQTSK